MGGKFKDLVPAIALSALAAPQAVLAQDLREIIGLCEHIRNGWRPDFEYVLESIQNNCLRSDTSLSEHDA